MSLLENNIGSIGILISIDSDDNDEQCSKHKLTSIFWNHYKRQKNQ